MSITLTALMKQRYDTAANWTTANPTLLAGEIGIESDTKKWKLGDGSTAWTSLGYIPGLSISAYPLVNADISATAEIAVSKLANGTARQLLQTDAAGTGVEFASNIDVPGTLDVTSAATFDSNVIIQGDLTVNGTETIINTQTLDVEDKNIVIGKVVTPSDVTADGGGITLKGTTDKTINWIDATDAWTFSEHVNIVSTKEYRIAGTKVLDATSLGSGVTSSSLTSVGTIATGVWNGTAINKTYLDATLVSTGDTGTVTSTMILDGTILNADINASAAIDGTKVSPNFGSQDVVTTGNVTVNGQGDVRFGDSDSSNYVGFQAPAAIAADLTWTLPAADGTNGQVLGTNGTGTLDWVTAAGGSTVIAETKQLIDQDYSLSVGFNGVSAGPVEVGATYTVTVPAGAVWVII